MITTDTTYLLEQFVVGNRPCVIFCELLEIVDRDARGSILLEGANHFFPRRCGKYAGFNTPSAVFRSIRCAHFSCEALQFKNSKIRREIDAPEKCDRYFFPTMQKTQTHNAKWIKTVRHMDDEHRRRLNS